MKSTVAPGGLADLLPMVIGPVEARQAELVSLKIAEMVADLIEVVDFVVAAASVVMTVAVVKTETLVEYQLGFQLPTAIALSSFVSNVVSPGQWAGVGI